MSSTSEPMVEADLARLSARGIVLRFLALAASDPTSERFARVFDADFSELAAAAARHLATDPATNQVDLAPGEVSPERFDVEPIVEALRAPHEKLVDEHTRVFGLVVSKECPPHEVQYCPQTFSIYRSQRMADIAGFYRAFGVEPGRDVPERVDHVACELEFLAWLVAKEHYAHSQQDEGEEEWAERAAISRDAQRDFVAKHLAWWVPAFAHALGKRAEALDPPSPLHIGLARALACLIPAERAVLGVEPPDELALAKPDEEGSESECSGCGSD
ncbi:MAG: hypothetical protein CMJ84_14995 [Planctomycetes bacterium]|jgi:TorA maturation chaperone TorD|nr:hypothetical protein [Planctomycetota bacterium]